MPHPHEYLLQEYRISIDKLVPLTPPEVVAEANALYEELKRDEHATERQIRQALIHIGKKEFPYRKAYMELCGQDEERRLEEAAFLKLDPMLSAKIRRVTDNGVHLTDYVKSKLFESELQAEERYRVEQALLESHDVINRQCDERAKERQESYEKLVADWSKKQTEIQVLIDQLRSMADRDQKWTAEIQGKADQFEEGWSIVERDPSEEDVRQEIANWSAVFEEGGEEDT